MARPLSIAGFRNFRGLSVEKPATIGPYSQTPEPTNQERNRDANKVPKNTQVL